MSAEAVQWVQAMVANLDPAKMRGSPGELEQHAEKLMGLNKLPATDEQAILIFDHHMADDESWKLAKSIVQLQLKKCIPLHPLLSRMAALMMLGDKAKEKGRPDHYERDSIAVALMFILMDRHGIAPTRGEASEHANSGADIVAAAMNGRGFNVTAGALMKAWGRHRKEFD